jgi:hypothetical protein
MRLASWQMAASSSSIERLGARTETEGIALATALMAVSKDEAGGLAGILSSL